MIAAQSCQQSNSASKEEDKKDTITVKNDSCTAWNEFVHKKSSNVLLDFSYAGYKHGEETPPDVSTLGYTVYNVKDYGAIPDDNISDRAALLAIIAKIGSGKANAKG